MIFVFLLVSVNVLILIVYVVVEATVSHFQTELEPNKETMSELVGVSLQKISIYPVILCKP